MKRPDPNRSSTKPVGYAALLPRFEVPDLGLVHASCVGAAGGTVERQAADGSVRAEYPRKYEHGDSTLDHLVFALKYDGIDLRVLRAVLAAMPESELVEGIRAQPTSQYMRRLWFLFEWLFERRLDVADLTQGNYVPLFDPARYVVGPATNSRRHRISVNGLGPAALCPIVRRTPTLERTIAEAPTLDARARRFIDEVPATTLWRATAWLYDKETRSSYAIEHETPKPGRAERFVAVLREAGMAEPMSRELLVHVQNSIVEADYIERQERTKQNWVGRTTATFEEEVYLVPPTPAALPGLLDAWIVLANRLTDVASEVPPTIVATVLSFAFVYLHPFLDGNGRTHRWLIHWALARCGFGPRDVVLPVSAAILRDMGGYHALLERASQPIRRHARYELRPEGLVVLEDHADLYRHLDLTAHAEALHSWLARTIDREMPEEVAFLERHDRAVDGVRAVREMPDRRERLFIQCVVQNKGRLSKGKRLLFAELPDEELARMESAVRDAFALDDPSTG
ncbi:MAG: Fic family protein [Deltaproteobacteria bacterium]|nr:Fic family protein [Deltaproteobacteria bacterium]